MTEEIAGEAAALEIRLRAETPEDESFLFDVYARGRAEELQATGWDEATRQAFLQSQFQAQRRGYRAMFPGGEFQIILRGGERAGRLVVHHAPDEIRLVDIALLPAHQNQGLGARLVGALIAEAEESRRPLRVSVFKPSRAAVFYRRLGFVKTGEAGPYDLWDWRPPDRLTPPG